MKSEAAAPPASWTGIRDTVLARIRGRDYAPGALIPTEAELAAEFGCARATVNRALRELAEAGWLDRRRKAGTRVAAEPRRTATLSIPLVRREIEAGGAAYDFVLLALGLGPLPEAPAAAMRVPVGVEMLHVLTLHRGDGQPRLVEDRWINQAAVPEILTADLRRVSANEWLVRNAPYTEGALTIEAGPAGAFGAVLGCEAGAAVLVVTRITWLDGAPVTHVVQTHAPGFALRTRL